MFKGGGYSYFNDEVLRLRGIFKSPWPFVTILSPKQAKERGRGNNIRAGPRNRRVPHPPLLLWLNPCIHIHVHKSKFTKIFTIKFR